MSAALCLREKQQSYGSQSPLGRDAAHDALVELARRRAADDVAMLEPLLVAEETRAFELLGLGSIREYCARLFGWGGRQTRERLRVARAVRSLPAVRERWARGELTYTVVRELTRVATPAVEDEWVAWATSGGVRRTGDEVQQVVMRHRRGDRPTDAPAPFEERRVRVVLEMSGSEASRLSEVRAEATRRLGHGVDDETLAKLLFDAFLRGSCPEDGGVSPHRVRLAVCERCGATERESGGEGLVPVDPAIGEVALCDAQVLRPGERASQTVPPATRRSVLARDEGKCAVPGCRHALLDVHHIRRRVEGGRHSMDNLVSLCSAHHDAAHRGRLVIRRNENGLLFERADGRPYGVVSGAETTRCADLSRHFEAIVEATGSEQRARARVDEALAPRSQPEEEAKPPAEVAPQSQSEAAVTAASTPAEPEPPAPVVPRALEREVHGLLTCMGYRVWEAQVLLDDACNGSELPTERIPTTEELLRASLRAGPPRRRPRRD